MAGAGRTPAGVAGQTALAARAPPSLKAATPKGTEVQFFFSAEPSDKKTALVRPKGSPKDGPQLLQSHGWLPGTLTEAYDPAKFSPTATCTWPHVMPSAHIPFSCRSGSLDASSLLRRETCVREKTAEAPLLSVVFVRWGGVYSKWMDEQEANDGDWGKYGSPPSDEYMTALVQEGLLSHPRLKDDQGIQNNVEIFNLFVRNSGDVYALTKRAPLIASMLKGKKKTMFWMLWPAEWEDHADPDFACYIERQCMFAGMRACEAAGLSTGFPHPADQFELITSKSWMATLSLHPRAHLPACVLVTKDQVLKDLKGAAKDALNGMEHVRALNPFPARQGDPPAPSEVNKDGIKRGVVKMGWSWENRFVSVFNNPEELQTRLRSMMTQECCTASYCIVQEWVDFDFEMRQYYLPPATLTPGQRFVPARIECNAWGPRSEEHTVGTSHASFSKLSEEKVLGRWAGDAQAWEAAKAEATEIAQFLIAWLVAGNARPVPMIRLDFMCKRLGPGKVRIAFGEYCEMGACCLGWKEGPPTIWHSAIDHALR